MSLAFKGFVTSSYAAIDYYLTQATFCNLLLNSFAALNINFPKPGR